jgi:hypothetical protein
MNLVCKLCGHESTRDDPVQDESLLPPIVYPVCVRILLCQERMIKKIKEGNECQKSNKIIRNVV